MPLFFKELDDLLEDVRAGRGETLFSIATPVQDTQQNTGHLCNLNSLRDLTQTLRFDRSITPPKFVLSTYTSRKKKKKKRRNKKQEKN